MEVGGFPARGKGVEMALPMTCSKGHDYIQADEYRDWPMGAPHCPECYKEWVGGQPVEMRAIKEEKVTLYLPHTFYVIGCTYCDMRFSYQAIIEYVDDYYEKQVDYHHQVIAKYCPYCGGQLEQ